MLIPLTSFLIRIFPPSTYIDIKDSIVNDRIFKPRKDCVDFKLVVPIDWEAENVLQDRNWRMQLQGWAFFFPIMNFFEDFADKEKAVQYFFDVARDWYNNYGNDPNDIVTSRMPKSFAWYDMSVGFRALVIAFFWNRIVENEIKISSSDSDLLEKLVEKHISHLSVKAVFSLNNHGIFQIQGLMALVQLSGIENHAAEYTYCLDRMVDLIQSQYSSQGIHMENSPHYHFYALNAFKNVVLSGWYKDRVEIEDVVVKAESAKRWLVDPNNCPACVGDSVLVEQKIENIPHDPILEIKNSIGILSNFSESGYQIFRSDWELEPSDSTYLFFMGMYHTKSHKHRDCLSFEWFDNGEKIICDSGKYGYVSDKYRNYFLSYKAHNTIEIEGFDILKIAPYGSCIDSAREKDGVVYLTGSLNFPAIQYKRELILKPGKWLIVKDKLAFKRARKITQWFHLEKEYQLESFSGSRMVFGKQHKKLIIRNLDASYKASIHYGDEDALQGFISEKDLQIENNYAIGFSKSKIIDGECISILALSKESELDALSFLGSTEVINEKKTTKLLLKNLINNILHINRFDNSHRYDLFKGKSTYSYFVNGIELFFFANIKENSDKLTIMLPGAVNRSKGIFNFQRYSWSDDVDGSVIVFLDPTVAEDNDITIGWFQGDANHYAIPTLGTFIHNLIEKNGFDEGALTLFGSSAGGFTCLKLADSFLRSTVKVINPQTRVYNYSPNEVNKLISWLFPHNEEGELTDEQKERLTISLNLDREGPIFYYQNKHDGHHVHKHLEPLLKTLPKNLYTTIEGEQILESTPLNVIYYEDAEKGHSPPSKEDTLKILNS